MSVSLSKGGNVSLTKMAPSLSRAAVGLGWDERSTTGAAYDLDASALLLGRVREGPDRSALHVLQQLAIPDGASSTSGTTPMDPVTTTTRKR